MAKEERARQMIKLNSTNTAKLLILNFLMEKSYYGNELQDKIKSSMNYKWSPSNGLVYPLLWKMEEEGWIEGWWDEPNKKNKRHYKITDEGIKHYNNIKLIYKPVIEEMMEISQSLLEIVYK